MKYTGIYATDEEKKQALEAAKHAATTPVIALSSAHAMRGGMSGDAWQRAKELCHKFALKHDLPEIKGFYGMTEDGEFVSTE